MRRIVILGNAGSGKSTLARRLGQKLGLPVSHLDVLFWRPGWVEPDNEGFRERVAEATAGEAWVSEGNYLSRTFDLRLPKADTLIWMGTPTLTCVRRVLWRSLFERKRADLAEGCFEDVLRASFPNFLKYVWTFEQTARPRMEEALKHLRPDLTPFVLKSAGDVRRFLQRAQGG